MSLLSQSMRTKAGEFRSAANSLLAEENAEKLAADVRQQISAVVGKLAATNLDALADMLDYLDARPAMDEKTAKRRTILEKNDAIRRAAATGNWAEFDRLTGDQAGGTTGV